MRTRHLSASPVGQIRQITSRAYRRGKELNEITRAGEGARRGIVKQRGAGVRTGLFWTLARSPGRKVLEVYVLDGDEGPIVVSGSAPRDRYTAFKAHLDAVFESMAR